MEESTNSRNFRENLKVYFDKAKGAPLAINRANDRFVLMSESEYVRLKEELMNLQKSLISALQTISDGPGVQYNNIDDHHEGLLEEFMADEPTTENIEDKKVAW